jgi:hypothetical protein
MDMRNQKENGNRCVLPHVELAGHRISRLILGNNPLSGVSHYTIERSEEMERYFTMKNAKALLKKCEKSGITAFQGRSDRWILHLFREHRDEGGSLKFICQTASEMEDIRANIRLAVHYGAIAVYHHGTQTDNYWNTGRIEEVREIMKTARDLGVAVGIGSHKPEVIEYIEEKDWDVDFYMTSFYNVYKNITGWKQSYIVTGVVVEDCFENEDRERMCRSIRTVSKPCLGFKILAAGRNCATSGDTENAFRFAFENIKPIDAVVVGMLPGDRNREIAQNVTLTIRYGGNSG